jgi:hypothetical protein
MEVARPYPPNAESVSGCSILPLAGHPMPKTHRNLERVKEVLVAAASLRTGRRASADAA